MDPVSQRPSAQSRAAKQSERSDREADAAPKINGFCESFKVQKVNPSPLATDIAVYNHEEYMQKVRQQDRRPL